MLCKECNADEKYLVNEICKKCYHKHHSKFFYKDTINKNVQTYHKQRNIITSKQKFCSVCGNYFFTQGRKNHGKTCSLKCRTKHYQLYFNTPEKREQRRIYHLNHLKERQLYNKKRELNDPTFKVAHLLRSNFRRNLALKFNDKKNTRFASLTGYSYGDARKHLEKQFTPNMSWSNYGKVWQIDHVIPLKMFKTKEQFIKRGWALKNLQPLESELNLAKQDKYIGNPKTKHKVIYL